MIDYVLCVSWGNDSVAMIQLALEWANSEHGQFNPDDGTGYDCDSGMCGL
jgi:hypothetical protein